MRVASQNTDWELFAFPPGFAFKDEDFIYGHDRSHHRRVNRYWL
jgi:hypothetical protein